MLAASSSDVVASSTRSGAATRASDAHSSAGSMLRRGVSVPPQSKITASIALPTDNAHHVVDDTSDRHVLTSPRGPVLHLDHAVGEPLADHDDRGHPEQLGVL